MIAILALVPGALYDTEPGVPVFNSESEVTKALDDGLGLGDGVDVEVGAAAIEMLSGCVVVLLAASFTCTVKEELPDPLGVPEIPPVDGARFKPDGSVP